MTGTIEDWDEWTGMSLPASGNYAIPQGMNTLSIDRETNLGTYVESNIWVQHL